MVGHIWAEEASAGGGYPSGHFCHHDLFLGTCMSDLGQFSGPSRIYEFRYYQCLGVNSYL